MRQKNQTLKKNLTTYNHEILSHLSQTCSISSSINVKGGKQPYLKKPWYLNAKQEYVTLSRGPTTDEIINHVNIYLEVLLNQQ